MISLRAIIKEIDGLDKLSPIQIQLIKHIVDGNKREEFGKLVGIPLSKVDMLLKKTMDQIGIKTLRELVLWAVQHKIIEDAPLHINIHKQLTDQQAFILLSILKGIPEEELSQKLNLSSKTVKRHIEELIKKFKIYPRRRTQLIRFALRAGWDPDMTFEKMEFDRSQLFRSNLTGLESKDSAIVSYILNGYSVPKITQKVNLSKDSIQRRFEIFRGKNGIKNFVDLVRWGREHGVLNDKPLYITLKNLITLDQFRVWILVMRGLSTEEIGNRLGINPATVHKRTVRIMKNFHLKNPNIVALIRLGFQIGLDKVAKEMGDKIPQSIGNITPSDFPIVPSKFQPFKPDPSKAVTFLKKKDKLRDALYTLGVDQSLILGKPFLKRRPEELWHLLELAKMRYEYETYYGHPDRFSNPEQRRAAEKRMAEVTYSWNLVQSLFARLGYKLQ